VSSAYKLTVRQLESMLRLAEALSKLEFSNTVELRHVHGAYNLMKVSIVKVDKGRIVLDDPANDIEDAMDNMDIDRMDIDPGPAVSITLFYQHSHYIHYYYKHLSLIQQYNGTYTQSHYSLITTTTTH